MSAKRETRTGSGETTIRGEGYVGEEREREGGGEKEGDIRGGNGGEGSRKKGGERCKRIAAKRPRLVNDDRDSWSGEEVACSRPAALFLAQLGAQVRGRTTGERERERAVGQGL